MKRTLLVCLVTLLTFASFAFGQKHPWDLGSNATPTAEVFGGFALNRTNFGQSVDPFTLRTTGGTTYVNAPGFEASFGYNVLNNVRLLADFAGEYKGTDIFDPLTGAKISTSNYQIMFGPEFVFRTGRIAPFVHVLGGWATRRFNVPTGQLICTGFSCSNQKTTLVSDSGGALAAGGGVDLRITQGGGLAWRVAQFDFIRSHLNRNTPNFAIDVSFLPILPSWQSNYRFATGIVLRLGERR